jgi:ketosteroid isomerase-like protein
MKQASTRVMMLIAVMFLSFTAFSQVDAELKSKVDKMNMSFEKATLEGNHDFLLSLYTRDAISLPSYEPMHEGIDAIRKASEMSLQMGWKPSVFELKSHKIFASGNLITDVGNYKLAFTMKGIDSPVEDHGKYITIYERQADGSLKIKLDMWNTDVSPMEAMGESK